MGENLAGEKRMTLTTPQAILLCATAIFCMVYGGKVIQETVVYNGIATVGLAKYESQKSADDKETARYNAFTAYTAREARRVSINEFEKRALWAEARWEKACRIHKGKC